MKQKAATVLTLVRQKVTWPLLAMVGGGTIAVALMIAGVWLTHGAVASAYQQTSVTVDAPFEVQFNQRLLKIPSDEIHMSPAAKGSWTVETSVFRGDVARFNPDEPLIPGTKYTISFENVHRFTGIQAEIPEVTFTTEKAPTITSVSFADKATIAADATLGVTLRTKNRGLRHLVLETDPKIAFAASSEDDTAFQWKSAQLLPQGKEMKIIIKDTISKERLVERTVTVASPPQLTAKPAETNFGKQDVATLVFDQPIDSASGKIVFSLEGEGKWRDESTYIFTPKEVAPGQSYSYTIPQGLRSKQGGIVEAEQKYTFSTPGVVQVAAFSPRGNELSQARQVIRVTFNQAVDTKSAERLVTVSRGTVVARTWQGSTLSITVDNLGLQQTVNVNVAPGVQPVFGLASTQHFGYAFTTEIPVRKLAVPYYRQQFAQSCEAADLRMALAYRGIHTDDMSIVHRFGYAPRPMNQDTNEWDDPQQQFVGDINGHQGRGTGWGVYAEPVARTVRSFGRGASVQYGVTAGFVAQNIHAGNPVILWGIWDESATQKSWKAPGGHTVSGPIPMHVRLVVGVKGSAENPVGFNIHDPITGPTYWTAGYMVYNAQRAGAANMAVSVQ